MTPARDRAAQLEAIAAEVRAHRGCGFEPCETATNPVPGEGSADAQIVFVGEAPGAQEDKQGRPFVGSAGKLLDQLLESIELDRGDVFISNVLKSRPPGNRDPKPDEVFHSWPWLKAQIELIRPKLIAPLGKHALDCFLPGGKISQDHGQLREAGGWTYFPLYHPAAAFRVRPLRETMFEDFARLPALLERLEPPPAELVIDPAAAAKQLEL
jgi:uracil-DNA glycosylase family 4